MEPIPKEVMQITQGDTVNPCLGWDKSQVSLFQGHYFSTYFSVLYVPKNCLELKVNLDPEKSQ